MHILIDSPVYKYINVFFQVSSNFGYQVNLLKRTPYYIYRCQLYVILIEGGELWQDIQDQVIKEVVL